MDDTLKRELEITPGYDHRYDGTNRGQHCATMRFLVKGDKGVVQFVVYSGWFPEMIAPPDKDWTEWSRPVNKRGVDAPMAADLGYHSPKPMYEGQEPMDHCDYLPQGCYYDGSSLNGYRLLSLMVHQGGEAMWTALEDYYRETFK